MRGLEDRSQLRGRDVRESPLEYGEAPTCCSSEGLGPLQWVFSGELPVAETYRAVGSTDDAGDDARIGPQKIVIRTIAGGARSK